MRSPVARFTLVSPLLILAMACGGAPPPSTGPAPAAAEPSDRRAADSDAATITASVVEIALEAMGTPYVWGGTSDNGFDCSGLIQYAYRQHGIELPRVSRNQMREGRAVERSVAALRPGDILGFNAQQGGRITHVGLYVGDNEFIHSSPRGVELADLTTRYWREHWVGARRVVP